MRGKISASVMCANFNNLEEAMKELEKNGVEYIHFDVMDGHFVPNFTMGPDMLKSIREMCNIACDIHLMTYHPENFIELFQPRLGDIISVHQEATVHLQKTLTQIRATGAKAGIALNPATSLSTLDYIADEIDVIVIMTVNPGFAGQKMVPAMYQKIEDIKEWITVRGKNILIEVDGNVSFEHAKEMRKKGADIFVGGSSGLFRKEQSITASVAKLRELIY